MNLWVESSKDFRRNQIPLRAIIGNRIPYSIKGAFFEF